MKTWLEHYQDTKKPLQWANIGKCEVCGQPAIMRVSRLLAPSVKGIEHKVCQKHLLAF